MRTNSKSFALTLARSLVIISALGFTHCEKQKPKPYSSVKPPEASGASTEVKAEEQGATEGLTKGPADTKSGTAKADAKKAATVSKGQRRPANTEKIYIVQIGAFSSEQNARKLYESLKAKEYPVMMRTLDHTAKGKLTLVRLTPSPNRSEAEAMIAKLKSSESLNPVLLIPKN